MKPMVVLFSVVTLIAGAIFGFGKWNDARYTPEQKVYMEKMKKDLSNMNGREFLIMDNGKVALVLHTESDQLWLQSCPNCDSSEFKFKWGSQSLRVKGWVAPNDPKYPETAKVWSLQ